MKNIVNSAWKTFVNIKKNACSITNIAERCLAKAFLAKSENKVEIACSLLRKAFSPVTNSTKLANGRKPWQTLMQALAWTSSFNRKLEFSESVGLEQNKEYRKFAQEVVNAFESGVADVCEPYMYIFVRQDQSPEQQLVQAAHVTYVMGKKTQNRDDHSSTNFIVIGVPDLPALQKIMGKLVADNMPYEFFVEPDIGNQITALSTYPISSISQRKKFSRFKLLKFPQPIPQDGPAQIIFNVPEAPSYPVPEAIVYDGQFSKVGLEELTADGAFNPMHNRIRLD